MTENNQFLSLPELRQKFNLEIPFTLYYGLVSAIPKEWKSSLKDALPRDNAIVEKATCSIKPLTTRATYSAFLSKMATSPTCESKIFKYGFTEENIQNVYLLPFTTTKDIKLITFQYKVIQNILPNRVSLLRAGIVNNDTCPLCNAEKQTSNHMLYTCPETTTFWGQFTDWWYQKFKQNLILNECIILYSWHQKSPNERVLNYAVFLLAKYHIFSTSVQNNRLDFNSFLSRLRIKLNILREVSIENKTLNNFQSTVLETTYLKKINKKYYITVNTIKTVRAVFVLFVFVVIFFELLVFSLCLFLSLSVFRPMQKLSNSVVIRACMGSKCQYC